MRELEDAFYALAALVLLLFGIVLVVRAADRFGGVVLARGVVVAAVAAAVIVVRDFRRRRWTPVSVGVAIAYALCFATVLALEVAGVLPGG